MIPISKPSLHLLLLRISSLGYTPHHYFLVSSCISYFKLFNDMSHIVCESTIETEVGNIYPSEKFILILHQTIAETEWTNLYLSGILAWQSSDLNTSKDLRTSSVLPWLSLPEKISLCLQTSQGHCNVLGELQEHLREISLSSSTLTPPFHKSLPCIWGRPYHLRN